MSKRKYGQDKYFGEIISGNYGPGRPVKESIPSRNFGNMLNGKRKEEKE